MPECPLYVWMSPICLDTPHMSGCPHMFGHPPVCLDAPICLDTPICLDAPCMCVSYVWMPPVLTQHKESMLCQTKGLSICLPYIWMPHMFGCPTCMFGCPHIFGCALYVQMPPVCFDAPYVWTLPVHLDAPHMLDFPYMF